MAQLVQYKGKYYKGSPGAWQEIDVDQFFQEASAQQQVQQQGMGARAMAGYSYYTKNLLSGARELTYGDPAQEQQFRADVREQHAPWLDYGGFPVTAGQFAGGASTAALPGGLKAQIGIGAAQGAAENPDDPLMGAGLGAALTWGSDWLAESLGRIFKTMTRARKAVDPDYAQTLARGEAEGLAFNPGQQQDDFATLRMQRQLLKNPKYMEMDLDRWLSNQAKLNSAAAEALGQTPTGRVTPQMRGRAVKEVGQAFDDIAEKSAPINLLGEDWITEFHDLTDVGRALHETMLQKFPTVFEGQPISGKDFINARNWLGKQVRAKANWESGAAEEMAPFLAVMDRSLAEANMANGQIVDDLMRARQKWKALYVIESSMRGAEQAAKGDLSAYGVYNVLKKVDKGGIFRGRQRDKFETIVDAMAAAGDVAPAVMPSTVMQRGPVGAAMDLMWNAPAVERYMAGQNIGRVMLGQFDPAGPATRGMQRGAIAAGRGIMAARDDE